MPGSAELVQRLVHAIEAGAASKWLRRSFVLVIVFAISVLFLYNFRGLATSQAMDQAQIGRSIAFFHGWKTSYARPLAISQLQGTLNFARTNADTCTIRGAFPLPSDYNFSNKVVTLNIGGAETSFTLDGKGRGLSGLSRFNKPSYNKTTHLWTFNAMLRNGSWHTSWAAHGLVNSTIVRPGEPVTLPVILAIDNQTFTATPTRHYTSLAGKSGNAR